MNSPETKPLALTYDERDALNVLRKAIRRKPEIIKLLMKDMGHEMAYAVLKQSQHDLKQLLEVTRAFAETAAVLAKQQKDSA